MTADLTKTCPTCRKTWPAARSDCPDDGSMLVYKLPEDASLIGLDVDGRYRVERLIAEGGMGRVYVARQLSVDRPVALKVLLRSIATNVQAVQRFQNEARAASRLTSAHTVTVYDFGQEPSGLLYIAMEYVEGRSLWRALEADGAFPVDRAVAIACQIIESLSEAHAKGIVHRDVKPDNVLLTATATGDEIAKVTDFGIAKVVTGEARTDLTTAGMVVGTPRYLSPEQIRGQTPDARSDIYSLGVVLYELLAGVPPFDDKVPMNLLVKHLTEEPILLHKLAPRVPGAISSAVHRALQKDREQRFESARAFRDALIQAMGHIPRVGAPSYHPSNIAVAETGMHATPDIPAAGSRSTTSPYDEEPTRVVSPTPDPAEEPTVVAAPAMRTGPSRGPARTGSITSDPTVAAPSPRSVETLSHTARTASLGLDDGDRAVDEPAPSRGSRTLVVAGLATLAIAGVALTIWQVMGPSGSKPGGQPVAATVTPAAASPGEGPADPVSPEPGRDAGAVAVAAADAGSTADTAPQVAVADTSPPADTAPPQAAPDTAPAPDAAAGTATADAAPADAAPTVRTVRVLSEPSGAAVLVGDERVGETPWDVEVPVGGSVEVTLQHKGYQDERRTFGDNTAPELTIALEKKKASTPKGPGSGTGKRPPEQKDPGSGTNGGKEPPTKIDVPYID